MTARPTYFDPEKNGQLSRRQKLRREAHPSREAQVVAAAPESAPLGRKVQLTAAPWLSGLPGAVRELAAPVELHGLRSWVIRASGSSGCARAFQRGPGCAEEAGGAACQCADLYIELSFLAQVVHHARLAPLPEPTRQDVIATLKDIEDACLDPEDSDLLPLMLELCDEHTLACLDRWTYLLDRLEGREPRRTDSRELAPEELRAVARQALQDLPTPGAGRPKADPHASARERDAVTEKATHFLRAVRRLAPELGERLLRDSRAAAELLDLLFMPAEGGDFDFLYAEAARRVSGATRDRALAEAAEISGKA